MVWASKTVVAGERVLDEARRQDIRMALLALRPDSGISWQDVVDITVDVGLGDFTQGCLVQLHRFHNSKKPVAAPVPLPHSGDYGMRDPASRRQPLRFG